MNLEVTRKGISDVLALLNSGEWQIPGFQREFVWSIQQAHDLLTSIFKARPIGMITAWAQPQGKPATDPGRIELNGEKFGEFTEDPAVIKLILDGKQRLTSLAIAFGGLRSPKGNQLFSGAWFLDFTQDPASSDEFITYKKKSEIAVSKLDSIPNCLALGLLPLSQYAAFNKLSQRIFDKDFYPPGQLPSQSDLQVRSNNLDKCQTTFNSYQIPIAELPSSVGLSDVCEIFEVLNTKGTKVSTFDLIHNTFFGKTGGKFSLREKFEELTKTTTKLKLLLSSSRPEFLCQLVTGIYLSTDNPTKRDGKTGENVTSIKGKDLLETPLTIYEEFLDVLPLIDNWSKDLFEDVLGSEIRLEDIPYPASIILYFALRWRQTKVVSSDKRYSVEHLNRVFKAFFWRNVLSNRYEQGFLTKFSTDLSSLATILQDEAKQPTSSWALAIAPKLDQIFGTAYPRPTVERLEEIVRSDEQRGALWQALELFLHSRVRHDLVNGKELTKHPNVEGEGIDLHHIYPKQWLRDNAANETQKKEYEAALNSLVNLIPLSAKSNKEWGTQAPAAFLFKRGIEWDHAKAVAESAMIDEEMFDMLKDDNAEPSKFWGIRAKLIVPALQSLQDI